ncbi:MAG TPA: SPFH domain-containing protein, partial [Hymenobacter sp.]
MENLAFTGVVAGAILFTVLVVGFILTRLYHRASKELSFVRTGAGGQKVVKDGGALVLPVFHETIPINMQTLRLSVSRGGLDALITKDRLRVDVKAEFYVRVKPDTDSIATAAQTLGKRTLQPSLLAELVEGKFIDALRAVAAGMDMQDLHEKRAEFVQKVQSTVAEDLTKNGLELETVSLTGLDQTDAKHFNPNNAFDAEGLAKLTRVVQERAKERNEIEADNRVAIETKNLEANSRSLELKQAQEFATLEQEKQVETRRAAQEAELATQRAERTREADLSRITAEQATEQGRIAAEQETARNRISAEQQTLQNRIAAEQKTEQSQVIKVQAVQIAEVEAAKQLELASQDQRIAVAERSQAQSEAQAAAET